MEEDHRDKALRIFHEEMGALHSRFSVGAVLASKGGLSPSMQERMSKVRNAIRKILADTASYPKSLNYAVEYCRYALHITDPHEMKVQCLYILGNITRWRHEDSKEVREILKKFTKEVK